MTRDALKPAFLLGLGAQKAGTTWFYQTVASHPQANMSLWKEYGFWDALYLSSESMRYVNYRRRLSTLENQLQRTQTSDHDRKRRQYIGLNLSLDLMMKGPEQYLAHFLSLTREDGVRLVGDITPSYARLRKPHLREISTKISDAGFTIRPVFILRDPLNRLTSAFNMAIGRSIKSGGTWDNELAESKFWNFCQDPHNQARTRYEITIQSLDSVFGRDGVKYLFFETLFQQKELDGVFSFLGLETCPGQFHQPVNRSHRHFDPSEATRRAVYAEFEETYTFCNERFGSLLPWEYLAR
jgi:hypothetical protein